MRYLADFDEIHAMSQNMLLEYSEDEIVENILNILRSAYIRGAKKTCTDLDWEYEDWLLFGDWDKEVILKEIKGKNVVDRIREHVRNLDAYLLAVVIDTEYHRDFNTGQDDMAETVEIQSGRLTKKVWHTQLDEKVRDTHAYLEGMEVDRDADFYTYDGDHASSPGNFSLPENSINCRCYLEYKWK